MIFIILVAVKVTADAKSKYKYPRKFIFQNFKIKIVSEVLCGILRSCGRGLDF